MSVPTSVTNWLYNVIQPQYQNKPIVYEHVCQFLAVHYRQNLSFKVKTRQFTDPQSGHSSLLINLIGTIPINVQQIYNPNAQYPVPVDIWIPFEYPNRIPVVYVTADHDNGLFLQANNNFDTSGRFYHPLLSDWFNDPSNPYFNLLTLVDVLVQSVSANSPITGQRPESIAPAKPAKNAPPMPAQYTGGIVPDSTGNRQSAGPPVPPKPERPPQEVIRSISSPQGLQEVPTGPSKYQKPLPLPSPVMHVPSYDVRAGSPIDNHFQSSPYPTSEPQSSSQRPQPSSRLPHTSQSPRPTQTHVSPQKITQQPDLLDSPQQSSTSSHLHQLSAVIANTSVDVPTREIEANHAKTDALYQQLSHHLQQARSNKENLSGHIDYVSSQLSNLRASNKQLQDLEEINNNSPHTVYTPGSAGVDIEDMVVADSVIVNQLYDVVADIKATKDCIQLIGGKFPGSAELINNANLDTSVRVVRNLGRELFWLELMKNGIGEALGLS